MKIGKELIWIETIWVITSCEICEKFYAGRFYMSIARLVLNNIMNRSKFWIIFKCERLITSQILHENSP